MTITILGSGTSSGVPTIGCDCPTCHSVDPRDKRLRPSIMIESDGGRVVVDTSSDFRQQCLIHAIERIDAIVYTHHHFDHIAGFDDLRAFNFTSRQPVPLFMMQETLDQISSVFAYAFRPDVRNKSSYPRVSVTTITDEPFHAATLPFQPLPLQHGHLRVNGYRIGDFAYCTDCNVIPDETMELLQGCRVLVLDALRHAPHPTHFTVEEAVEIAGRIGARETYFTHIAHEILHAEVEGSLPEGMHLAYDGLVLEVG